MNPALCDTETGKLIMVSAMESFLRSQRIKLFELLKLFAINGVLVKKPAVTIVLGNESCDLDSASSAVAYAFHLQKCSQKSEQESLPFFVPVLNTNRSVYNVLTEVDFVFSKVLYRESSVTRKAKEYLTFKDDFDVSLLSAASGNIYEF